jgi:hypothetical protein
MKTTIASNFYYPRCDKINNSVIFNRLDTYDKIKKRIQRIYSVKTLSLKNPVPFVNTSFLKPLKLVETRGIKISLKPKQKATHKDQSTSVEPIDLNLKPLRSSPTPSKSPILGWNPAVVLEIP